MPSATLTPADLVRFERDGYVVVRQAFAREDAAAMEARWWTELAQVHGIHRDDRTTWRPLDGDLKAAKRDPLQQRILTDRLRGAFDQLLGPGEWLPPKDWGRTIVTFPESGAWDVPSWFWHWDNPCHPHLDRPRALFVVSFVGEVAPRSGGTLVLAGSHRLLIAHERSTAEDESYDRVPKPWYAVYRSHPWLAALAGEAPSPADRVAMFMDRETEVDGVPLGVVELTGEPGDMVLCHPLLLHCGAPNRGDWPRMMRIRQQVLTREGRDRRRSVEQA